MDLYVWLVYLQLMWGIGLTQIISTSNCGAVRTLQGPSARIVGGTAATQGQYPWMAMLIVTSAGKPTFQCGGTVIDPLHIVTAAHCVKQSLVKTTAYKGRTVEEGVPVDFLDVTGLMVIVGRQQHFLSGGLEVGEQRRNVTAAIKHAQYQRSAGYDSNDIALLRLESNLTFNERVSALCLPSSTAKVPPLCTVAGWGDINGSSTASSQATQLMASTMEAYGREDCLALQSRMSPEYVRLLEVNLTRDLANHSMCLTNSTYGGQETCSGDSGGPVFCLAEGGTNFNLMGVVSWGHSNTCQALPAFPSINTFVPAFLLWINDTAGDLASGCAAQPCPLGTNRKCVFSGSGYECKCLKGYSGLDCTVCGEEMTSREGSFTSINYPAGYLPNQNCVWTIPASSGQSVYLTICDMAIESSETGACDFDWLEIRETNLSGRSVIKLCGDSPPGDVTVTNTPMWINFRSDNFNSRKGFNASYMVTPTACLPFRYGRNCSKTCDCVGQNTLACNSVNGTCSCKAGWEGVTCSENVDECALMRHNCTGVLEECMNTNNTYECVCTAGAVRNISGECMDCPPFWYGRNCSKSCECIQKNSLSCNTVNGTCSCKAGWEGVTCSDDIDECANHKYNCTGRFEACLNTNGSYECICTDGAKRNDQGVCEECAPFKYGKNCSNTCDCAQSKAVSCNRVNGTCACKASWEGVTCSDDVDECSNHKYNCTGRLEACQNTNGSYECVCTDGAKRNDQGVCEECSPFKYGKNCANTCDCAQPNTLSCNRVNGTCACKAGWEGVMCSDDVDECKLLTHNCTRPLEECTNTNGSYRCMCTIGAARNGSGECRECSPFQYGSNCSRVCECNQQHTLFCSAVNGACSCKAGWEGTTCSGDVDECRTGKHNCTGHFEECNNTVGEFQCTCTAGATKDNRGACVETTAISFTVVINQTIEFDHTNSSSASNVLVRQQIQEQLVLNLVNKTLGIFIVNIKEIRNGSLIVEAEVVVAKATLVEATSVLARAFIKLSNARLLVGGLYVPVQVTILQYQVSNGSRLCDVFRALGSCVGSSEKCDDSTGQPVCRTTDDSVLKTWHYILIGVGSGIIFLVIVITSVTCFLRHRRRSVSIDTLDKRNQASYLDQTVATISTEQLHSGDLDNRISQLDSYDNPAIAQ